jgi:hypothetical protein
MLLEEAGHYYQMSADQPLPEADRLLEVTLGLGRYQNQVSTVSKMSVICYDKNDVWNGSISLASMMFSVR